MREFERRVVLSVLDRKWREHLYEMDYLREGVSLRGYGQRDPLVEYQREGYDMFTTMMDGIKEESVGSLFNLQVQVQQDPIVAEGDEAAPALGPAAAAGPALGTRPAPAPAGNGAGQRAPGRGALARPPRTRPSTIVGAGGSGRWLGRVVRRAARVRVGRSGRSGRVARVAAASIARARPLRPGPGSGRPRVVAGMRRRRRPRSRTTCPAAWPHRAWPGPSAPASSATPRPPRTGQAPPSGTRDLGGRGPTTPRSAGTPRAPAARAASSSSATATPATASSGSAASPGRPARAASQPGTPPAWPAAGRTVITEVHPRIALTNFRS